MYWSAPVAITKYHTLSGLNKRNVSPHSLGNGKSKVKVPAKLAASKNPLAGLQTATFPPCHHIFSSYKTTNPRANPHDLNYLP